MLFTNLNITEYISGKPSTEETTFQ